MKLEEDKLNYLSKEISNINTKNPKNNSNYLKDLNLFESLKGKKIYNIFFILNIENSNEINNHSPKKNKEQIFLVKKRKKINLENKKIIKNEYYSFIKYKNLNEIENVYNYDKFLLEKTENLHKIRKNYMNNLNNLTIKKRIILLDWLMEISFQLHFKRETYYLAITLIDIYFSILNESPKLNEIQLIGLACLLISNKIDNVSIPSIKVFAYSCEFCYTNQEIINCHDKILKTLKWNINYPTLNEWGNFITSKWDSISEKNSQKNVYIPKFRNDVNFNNKLLFEFFLLLDLITLDYYYIFMNEKDICVSLIYFIIGIYFQYFTKEDIINNFENVNNVCKLNKYKNWFISLCEMEFDIQRNKLNKYLIYTSQFFHLNLENKENNFLNIQNQFYNKNNINTIEKIYNLRPNNGFL